MKKNYQWLLLLIAGLSHATFAETLYIHDNLRVDMRSGPSLEYRIIDFLSSGTELEPVSHSGEWIKIRTSDKEGWIQSQYTTQEPVAKDKLRRAVTEIQTLRKQNNQLEKELGDAQQELKTLKSNHSKVSSSAEQLQQELDHIQSISNEAIATEAAYRRLQEETELLKVEMEKLKVDNVRLEEDNLAEGIKWGIAAVLAGIILAWIISKSSSRKRRSEW